MQKPTRQGHLLDLVLSHILSGISCKVLHKTSDHHMVLARVLLHVVRSSPQMRSCFDYGAADWASMADCFTKMDWTSILSGLSPNAAASVFTTQLVEVAGKFVPCVKRPVAKTSHPWLNDRCSKLIEAKIQSEGTPAYTVAQNNCSKGLLLEHDRFICNMRNKIQSMGPSSKKWWKLSSALMLKAGRSSGNTPLQDSNGKWVLHPRDKAQLFADTFSNKYSLPGIITNEYSEIRCSNGSSMSGFLPMRKRSAKQILLQLRDESGSGPDLVAARVLKKCTHSLAYPVALLARLVIQHGHWPEMWKKHWVNPLYKKLVRSCSKNYRGIHLTSQLSKVVERLVFAQMGSFLSATNGYGQNQFAYTRKRGHRDALAYLVFQWVWAVGRGKRVAVYCSDVSGAFDRVSSARLIAKLQASGVHPQLVALIEDWLRGRTATVCVDGCFSDPFPLVNMVYQGTVLGPALWNVFFADAARPVAENGFSEAVFADDLNCFKVYDQVTSNCQIAQALSKCQNDVHKWGEANQVSFEPSKESFHTLDRKTPVGDCFLILGVMFDPKLQMIDAVERLTREAGWRMRAVLRCRRFYDARSLVRLYKCHVLSFLEAASPAYAHAAQSVLKPIDGLQRYFLDELDITDEQALVGT